MNETNQDIPFEELLEIINEKIPPLREKLRAQADRVIPEIPIKETVTGNLFVESVGSIIEFEKTGNFEYTYTQHSLRLRAPSLIREKESREKIFNNISQQLPAKSRLLNIGAGGDTVLPLCMESAGHEIISTDYAQETIDVLAKQINSPTFACDLIYIDEILPENSIDFILGNSTLGYVDPRKLRQVISKLSGIMRHGGIFTFDLVPNSIYYQIQAPQKRQTVANGSDVDPTKLIEFVDKYGKFNGINAMAIYSYYRAHYTNAAIVFILKDLFEEAGLSCNISLQQFSQNEGGIMTQFLLRVSKDYPDILNFIKDEHELTNIVDVTLSKDDKKLWYRLALVDRQNGEILARKFGIHKNKREDPWNVAHYINEHLWKNDLPSEIKEKVLYDIDPQILYDKIKPFVDSETLPEETPLPWEILLDQITHKVVIDGSHPMSFEEADAKIDQAYEEAERKKRLKKESAKQKKQKQLNKTKRKQARKSRKKK
ncbi:MAG: class I SAM-dependent methyltransferase [Desulfobacula sp.]|jgi:hypothetical protein|nr:class I SAM-dependent methyltransferase [Desulfobacula sp.]